MAAETVYVVLCEHQTIPGVKVSTHRTEAGAETRAAEHVKIMAKDSGSRVKVDVASWRPVLDALQDKHGAQFCYVEIIETKLED